jgi:hypothetical protein
MHVSAFDVRRLVTQCNLVSHKRALTNIEVINNTRGGIAILTSGKKKEFNIQLQILSKTLSGFFSDWLHCE